MGFLVRPGCGQEFFLRNAVPLKKKNILAVRNFCLWELNKIAKRDRALKLINFLKESLKKNAFGARGATKNSFSDAVKILPIFAPILCERCCNFRVAAMGPNCVFKVLATILATRLKF